MGQSRRLVVVEAAGRTHRLEPGVAERIHRLEQAEQSHLHRAVVVVQSHLQEVEEERSRRLAVAELGTAAAVQGEEEQNRRQGGVDNLPLLKLTAS